MRAVPSGKRFPKIGIFGNFGTRNFGNEGTLEAMLHILRRISPDADILCICSEPETVMRNNAIEAHALRVPRSSASTLAKICGRVADIPYAFKRIWDLDILLIPGTGLLDDTGERPHGIPLALFTFCLAARTRGIKIGFVSVGAGPMNHPVSRWLMKAAVKMASYCSFRDALSKDFMASLGLDPRDFAVYPDIAFDLPEPERTRPPNQQLQIGVGLMTYDGWRHDADERTRIYEDYLKKMTTFVGWLLSHDYSVRLLTGEDIDQHAVDDLLNRLSYDGRIVAEPVNSLSQIMEQFAQTDIVVATRYHNLICALKVGIPVISIGYSERHAALLSEVDLERFSQNIESLDIDSLIGQFKTILSQRTCHGKNIQNITRLFKQQLYEQEELLLHLLPQELSTKFDAAHSGEEPRRS